ncbi:hypothetical protein MMC15_007968 [Xylographa vitiligo]|nr:hypothetical protein [Xylographa vitiligo]
MQRAYASSMESLPRVAQPSVWNSMVPRFFRERKAAVKKSTVPKSKEWNPATFYIIMFLLIGSNAIQMIALRNDFTTFSRKADAKIGLLREVLERVQRGEDVDVEGLLGTGNEEKEKEWEEVLREIEQDEQLWQTKAAKKEKKAARAATMEQSSVDATPTGKGVTIDENFGDNMKTEQETSDAVDSESAKATRQPLAFY